MLRVLTPATATRLTTPETLGGTGVGAGMSADALGAIIDRASSAIESYTGRRFARESVEETFHTTRRDVGILLSRWPATVEAITVDGATLTGDDYEVDAGIVYRLRDGLRVVWEAARVTVVYDAGYILPDEAGRDLPHDVEAAALALSVNMLQALSDSPGGHVKAATYGDSSITYTYNPQALPLSVTQILDPYRQPTVG